MDGAASLWTINDEEDNAETGANWCQCYVAGLMRSCSNNAVDYEISPVHGGLMCHFLMRCQLGMGIRLNCLNRSLGELTIDFRLIINIFILKFTIYRLY